jgi:DNA-binding response OmpR family regulator
MLHWAKLLGLRTRSAAKDARDGTASRTRVLAITADDCFYSTLVEIASSSGWEIRRATTAQEGLDIVCSFSMPLVIFDWDENGPNWRGGLDRLSAARSHPCILLASRVVDDNLRQEVIRFGGYDVLVRSAGRELILRTIQFAWFWITRSHRFSDGATQQEACH